MHHENIYLREATFNIFLPTKCLIQLLENKELL